ncbi:MAG: diguanylate cyclase [Lachnospiraceae bacterium]|nr:diguanylate cyclase [Lachnospiraceae bacterium]
MTKEKGKQKAKTGSITGPFLTMALMPLILLSLVIGVASSYLVRMAVEKQVKTKLKNMALAVETTLDTYYPGDYEMVSTDNGLLFCKGEQILSGHYELLDAYREKTEIDITLFYQDARVLTTVHNKEHERVEGTGVHTVIRETVLGEKEEVFYSGVAIGDMQFFAYYRPLYNANGELFGMIGVATPTATVRGAVSSVIWPISLLCAIGAVVAAIVSFLYSQSVLNALKKMEQFLFQVSRGRLTATLDPSVSKRNDEIGKMGTSAVEMEKSLRDLIEKDALTGLYNRRYGNTRLADTWKRCARTGQQFAIAIGDIDYFKKVNDTYGHEYGDLVLKSVADVFRKNMGGKGVPVRWGGEEFLFIFEDMGKSGGAEVLQDMLEQICEMNIPTETGEIIKVTMTFGIVEGDTTRTIDEVVSRADTRLYEGKNGGRNRIIED